MNFKCSTHACLLRCFSCVQLFATPLGDFPDPGIKPVPFASPALAGGLFATPPPKSKYSLSCFTGSQKIKEISKRIRKIEQKFKFHYDYATLLDTSFQLIFYI